MRAVRALMLLSLVGVSISFAVADDVPQPKKQVASAATDNVEAAIPSETPNAKAAAGSSRIEPTHKQARLLVPKHDGQKIALNTFCLTPTGEILAAVGGPAVEYVLKPDSPGDYEIKYTKQPALVQKYSADGELVAEFPLDFKATGINMMPDGKEFVIAGEGWLARLTMAGELVKKQRTPNVKNLEKFKEQALEEARAEVKEEVSQFTESVKQIEKRIAELEKTPEEKRTKNVNAQLEAQKQQLEETKSVIEQIEKQSGVDDPDEVLRDRLRITGVAVSAQDLFVCLRKLKGYGYEVWRTNHDFTEGERVVENVSGCCGQLDIQANADQLLIAENGKFRVGIYDRDGDLTSSFGKKDRKAGDGFGSCCNPMNVRCCANGDVLTAESSIGDIKRFSAKGEFLGYIGRAKIGGGCKHVAIGYDAARDRYYMQHQDKNHICVLVPKSEVTGPTEEETLALEARKGLGEKIVGEWAIPGAKTAKKRGGVFGVIAAAFSGGESQGVADRLTFADDGALKVTGGQLAAYGDDTEMQWSTIRQDGKTLHVCIAMDGVETYNFVATFENDDTLKIDLRYEEQVMASATFNRVVAAKEDAKGEKADAKPTNDKPSDK